MPLYASGKVSVSRTAELGTKEETEFNTVTVGGSVDDGGGGAALVGGGAPTCDTCVGV